ncbi:rhomboid-like protein 15 isoform X4 [Vitis vinifera]|uniref:rhomboid-like protein 15 isoform X4 n=1 Tax=Vitis vinifera TaxID=29760 RepID=UPI0028833B36|nr:rhomboid-like protein 15 isoform X4 [Vitis vinifera]
MRPNIVSEAGLRTRFGQWWDNIPFLTSAVVIICSIIYLVCLLVGYDSFVEICFSPSAIISQFQVYRIYTAIIFHGSLLHVLFNMMALVPLGSELERIMGSVRLFYMIVLLATSNAIFHVLIASLVAYNPFYSYHYLMNECAIGFSGILFSMIVIETSLSGAQTRSVFGLFNVPAKWYAWILLVVFQLLMTNVSLLGHLCGILSGFAYTYGLFNFLIPGTSFYSAIESSSLLATQESSRFPGRGRTLSSSRSQTTPSDSTLEARLLDNSNLDHSLDVAANTTQQQVLDERRSSVDSAAAVARGNAHDQDSLVSEEDIQKLVSMGFERTQVEVALAAADGDLNIAVEILSQQG